MKDQCVKRLHIAALLFVLSPTFAASFDCARARNATEKTICTDRELSILDEELGVKFKKALVSARNSKALINEQRTWIKQERNSCADAACLKRSYKSRIAELSTKSVPEPCPISEHALLGAWKGVGATDFDEMVFKSNNGKRTFLSWRHEHIEMTGHWELQNCEIHIAHPDNSMLSFDYKIRGYENGVLNLLEVGEKEARFYQRIR